MEKCLGVTCYFSFPASFPCQSLSFLSFALALIWTDMWIKENATTRALKSVGLANLWPRGFIFSTEANLDNLPHARQGTRPEWQPLTAVISNGPGVNPKPRHYDLVFVWSVSALSCLSDPCVLMFACPVMTVNVWHSGSFDIVCSSPHLSTLKHPTNQQTMHHVDDGHFFKGKKYLMADIRLNRKSLYNGEQLEPWLPACFIWRWRLFCELRVIKSH